jgi:leucyl-tRNA synthetase
VPAHDERDAAFAERFDIPITPVIDEEGVLVNSAQFDGLRAEDAKRAIVDWLGERNRGKSAISFRLRDWGFSRQRYWGSPIPIVYCDEHGAVPVPEDELPVLLPEVEDYKPKGVAPLASAPDWVRAPCPTCGKEGRREVETMDTFVDSSWYFLRFCDPHNHDAAWDREIVDWWNPVDQYIGGVDHATMHLIYARFFIKALNDLGLVGFREPFLNLFTNGWVQLGGSKMSKSKGNVIGPDELVEEYGADAVRLYMLFIGPAREDMDWTDEGIDGMQRFVRRLYRLVGEVAERAPKGEPSASALTRKAHATIAKVTDDVGRRQSFNTAIAAVMELVNELSKAGPDDQAARFAAETAVSVVQPYAPHVAEELWAMLGHERLWEQPWPVADASQLVRDTFELVVQVNGKVRDRFEVEAGASEDELVERARASSRVQSHIDGATVRKTIVVPDKLVNFVVG